MHTKIEYNKPALSINKQVDQLIERGLNINDQNKVYHILAHINYYRLSGYFYPFLADKINHVFQNETDFETVFRLYCFDRKLRLLVLSDLEKIEVALRTKLIYTLSHRYTAFWFTDETLFTNVEKYKTTMEGIIAEYQRCEDRFIKSFRNKYCNPLPPSWILLEIISFGSLSWLYQLLKPQKEKYEIAHHYGLRDKVLTNWMHCLVYTRNVCAHHARFWNRELRIAGRKPRVTTGIWLSNTDVKNNKTYFLLSMVIFLLQTINPKSNFKLKLKSLFEYYPEVNLKDMGFPDEWGKEKLWS